jgi:hypothetical protein
MTTRITDGVKLDAAHRLLCDIAARYYLGCKAFHICAETGAPERVHWHIRLKTLAQFGNRGSSTTPPSATGVWTTTRSPTPDPNRR